MHGLYIYIYDICILHRHMLLCSKVICWRHQRQKCYIVCRYAPQQLHWGWCVCVCVFLSESMASQILESNAVRWAKYRRFNSGLWTFGPVCESPGDRKSNEFEVYPTVFWTGIAAWPPDEGESSAEMGWAGFQQMQECGLWGCQWAMKKVKQVTSFSHSGTIVTYDWHGRSMSWRIVVCRGGSWL